MVVAKAGERANNDSNRQPPPSVHSGTAHGTANGAHARCARPPPSNRAHRAPPIRGCAAGCAVGGATPRPGAPVATLRWGRGGPLAAVSRKPRRRTAPSLKPALGAVTLSNENALSRFRACPHPPRPLRGPERAIHCPRSRHRRFAGMLERGKAADTPVLQLQWPAGPAWARVGVGPLMGTQATRVPGEPGRWPFALVRTPAGRGHAHKPRVTLPRSAT
jgi:hypothetical protein